MNPVEAVPAQVDLDPLAVAREARRQHQARLAPVRQTWIDKNEYYYAALKRLLRFIIEPGRRVLNVRSVTGDLLHALEPSHGVGVEISDELLEVSRRRHPEFQYVRSDPETLAIDATFDYVLFSDVPDTVDLLAALKRTRRVCEPHTRLLVYGYNRLWQPLLEMAGRLGFRMPVLEPNWLSERDVAGLLRLAGFEPMQTYRIVLIPIWIPLISAFCNSFLARLPLISHLCMVNVVVARPEPPYERVEEPVVSVIIPCRNERGNVEPAVRRIPELGRHTEVIFCDDHSNDGTADEVRRMQLTFPDKNIRLLTGPGICKAENVWVGFRAARGDILVILDGDLAVMPEELPYFVEALQTGRGEFINGSRLVYPVPKRAMKLANTLGNKAFGLLFSFMFQHPVKDTLCGTKVLWRRDWERMQRYLGTWGVEDRWGDYELLFGAAKLQLAIVDLPVHYQERMYGVTKMTRVFQNGLRMLRMSLAAGLKLRGGY